MLKVWEFGRQSWSHNIILEVVYRKGRKHEKKCHGRGCEVRKVKNQVWSPETGAAFMEQAEEEDSQRGYSAQGGLSCDKPIRKVDQAVMRIISRWVAVSYV